MFIQSSTKTRRELPCTCILIIMFINLVLLGGPAEAIKCYQCTCWADCVTNKNLFHEMECAPHENACVTRYPTKKSEVDIGKQCWNRNDGATEEGNKEGGTRFYKYCYTDLCNDQEAGGVTNPNPTKHHRQPNSNSSTNAENAVTRSKISDWVVAPAMIMAYVGRCWLIN